MELTYREIAHIKHTTVEAVKMWLCRAGIRPCGKRTTPDGIEVTIACDALLSARYITQEDVNIYFKSQQLLHLRNEENALIASDIVRKKFDNERLTDEERALLSALCSDWTSRTHSYLVTLMSEVFDKSKRWLYLDHHPDRRKQKESAYEKLTTEQKDIVEKLYLQNRNIKNWRKQCQSHASLPTYSRATWYRIANVLERKLRAESIILNQGTIALKQTAPFVPQDYTALRPLELIVGDGWRVDRMVWWDNELITPTLIAWMDVRTKMFVGYALTKHENSLAIKTALFYCFWNYGIPEKALMDLGKSFRAARIAGNRNDERIKMINEIKDEIARFGYRGILPSLGIEDVRAGFKSPTAKPIERQFGRGGLSDWAKDYADWAGNKYWTRPEIIEKHRKMLTRRRGTLERVNKETGEYFEFCDIADLAASLHEYFEEYHNRPSEGFGMDGKSPLQLWTELTQQHPPRRADVKELAFAFLEGPERPFKILKSGYIELKKYFYYYAPEQYQHAGEYVYIRYNPLDGFWFARADRQQFEFLPKKILVFDERGKYLCESTYVERINRAVNDPSQLSEAMARKNEVRQRALARIQELSINKNISPLQIPHPPMNIIEAQPYDVIKMSEEEKQRIEETENEHTQKTNSYRRVFI